MNYRVYMDSVKSTDMTHTENEDRYMFSEFSFMKDKKIKLMVVADGMGGLSDGDKASRNAIDGFTSYFMKRMLKEYTNTEMEEYSIRYAVNDIIDTMINAIKEANREVCLKADPYSSTGSTISAICIIEDCAVIANVGDSPVYFYKKKKRRMNLVSELQTKAELDVKAGVYDRYSDDYYNNSHRIYCSLGQFSSLQEDDIHVTAIGGLEAGDVILAGSDGSFGYLKEKVLYNLIEDCNKEEEEFFLQQLFLMARLDKEDDQTAFLYIVSDEEEE